MKLYVSGPMTDIPEFNFPLFDEVTASLRDQGHVIFSPAEHDRSLYPVGPSVPGYAEGNVTRWSEEVGFDYPEAIATDIRAVLDGEGIVMLPGWENSTGARYERIAAEARGLAIYTVHKCEVSGDWNLASDVDQKRLTKAMKDGLLAALAAEVA